jgi:hypothetical protein
MSIQRSASPALLATIVAVTAGFLYLFTAARDIVVGDSPDLITAAVVLGVPHPPGYPLFTLLGHLFSLLPLGAIPFRVNLVSVVCDALTAGIVFLTAFRLSRSPIAAAAGRVRSCAGSAVLVVVVSRRSFPFEQFTRSSLDLPAGNLE